MAVNASSYIPTVAAALTRNRDQCSFPFNARPQASTAYVRFVWLSGDLSLSDLFVLQVGSLSTANPRFVLDINAGSCRVLHINAAGTVKSSSVSGASLVTGNTVEMRGILNADGSVQLGLTISGGAETLGAASAAQVLPQAWASPNLSVNSAGSIAVNFCAYRNVLVLAGVLPLQTCRAIAGVA